MTPADVLLLTGAGIGAGAVNAAAGGGTLITFPALLATGLPALDANITSSVGLLTGYAGGSVAYRRELAGQGGRIRAFGATSVIGGLAGAVLLLTTPRGVFRAVVPWLIVLACLLFLAQPRLAGVVQRHRPGTGRRTAAHACVLLAAVYGSYFGAGLGVILLAVLGVFLPDDLQRLNALKGLLSLVVNVVGVVLFAIFGPVDWLAALVLAVSAYAGGNLGVALARRLPAQVLRLAVVVLGLAVAVRLLL